MKKCNTNRSDAVLHARRRCSFAGCVLTKFLTISSAQTGGLI